MALSPNVRGAGIAVGSIALFILLLLVIDNYAVTSGYVKKEKSWM
jgi:hypothetical protein